MLAHLSVDFLHIIVYTQFVTFRVGCDCAVRIPAHGNLVRLDKSDLTILVQNAERVSFGLEYDAYGLHTAKIG
jgi:hypothetical protein